MQQIIIDFGQLEIGSLLLPVRIYGYGLMLVCGFVVGILLARRRARRCGEDPDTIPQMGILALIGGIAGARLAYVIKEPQLLDEQGLAALFDVTSGGLVYYGGVIGAMILLVAYLVIRRLPWRRYLDIIAVSLMVGLAFGRAGCLLNGCCWGKEVRDDWALSTEFPLYSAPLLNFSDTQTPYSFSQAQPTPPYQWQYYEAHRIEPDERLLNLYLYLPLGRRGPRNSPDPVLPAYDLHGPLERDQLGTMLSSREDVRAKFVELAGADGLLDYGEFRRGLHRPGSMLRGSEQWTEALVFQADRSSSKLAFEDLWRYFQARRATIFWRFDADNDGRLDAREQQAANSYLQVDQQALAGEAHTTPLQPAQLLGIVNALLIAGLASWYFRHRRREGEVFALLLILYPIGRFLLESLRYNDAAVPSGVTLTHNQWTSIGIFVVGVLFFTLLRRLPASAGPTLADRGLRPEGGQAID